MRRLLIIAVLIELGLLLSEHLRLGRLHRGHLLGDGVLLRDERGALGRRRLAVVHLAVGVGPDELEQDLAALGLVLRRGRGVLVEQSEPLLNGAFCAECVSKRLKYVIGE